MKVLSIKNTPFTTKYIPVICLGLILCYISTNLLGADSIISTTNLATRLYYYHQSTNNPFFKTIPENNNAINEYQITTKLLAKNTSPNKPNDSPHLLPSQKKINSLKAPRYCFYELPDSKNAWFDHTHSILSFTICRQIANFDQFFGNSPGYEEYMKNYILVRQNFTIQRNSDNTEFYMSPHVNAHIELPNIEQKLKVLISDTPNTDTTTLDNDESTIEQASYDSHHSTRIRWTTVENDHFELDFDIGVRLQSGGLESFLQARYRQPLYISERSLFHVTQISFWKENIGYGEQTQFNFLQEFNQKFLFRWHTSGTFSESSDGIDWSQQIELFHSIKPQKGLSYRIYFIGHSRPHMRTEFYSISVRYRQNILRPWLFYEIEPGYFADQEDDLVLLPFITLRLEVKLGK